MTIKRLNYAAGQFLIAEDFQIEQAYHKDQRRRIAQALYTPGVASGMGVDKVGGNGKSVKVSPGFALDANGAEVVLEAAATVDLTALAAKPWLWLTIAYAEAGVDPGPVLDEDKYLRRQEEKPRLAVSEATFDGSGNAAAPDGLNLRLALLRMEGGNLAEIQVSPVTRQSAGARRLAGGTDVDARALNVTGAAQISGATTLGGATQISAPVTIGAAAGQSAPATMLTVKSNVEVKGSSLWVGDVGTTVALNSNGERARLYTSNQQALTLNEFGGSVGIGNPAPQGTLHLGNMFLSADLALGGATWQSQDGARLHYNTNSRVGVLDTRGLSFDIRGDNNGNGSTQKVTVRMDTGNVGIGAYNPLDKLHVAGPFLRVDGAGGEMAYLGGDGGRNGNMGLDVQMGSFNPGVWSISFYNPVLPNANAPNGKGSMMDIVCRTMYGTKSGYVVDQFINARGDAVSEGDVLVIGANQAKLFFGVNSIPVPEVDLASKAYDTRVCGIVSEVRAETMDDLTTADGKAARPPRGLRAAAAAAAAPKTARSKAKATQTAVADEIQPPADRKNVKPGQVGHMATLGAFAHCKVDADIAPIKVGDLLTTSPTPGHAQKVLDRTLAVGAIIGKALAPLKKGKGKIPVMVTLQ